MTGRFRIERFGVLRSGLALARFVKLCIFLYAEGKEGVLPEMFTRFTVEFLGDGSDDCLCFRIAVIVWVVSLREGFREWVFELIEEFL